MARSASPKVRPIESLSGQLDLTGGLSSSRRARYDRDQNVGPRPVVLVSETPSLGAALLGLLEAEGYSARSVRSVREARALLRRPGTEDAMLVVASNGWSSDTMTEWSSGKLGERPLVLVGSRDTHLRSHRSLYVVHLPTRPSELLSVVHRAASETLALPPGGPPPARSKPRRTARRSS